MKRLSLLFAALLVVLAPTSAFAYSYTFSCGPSWRSLPVSYWINSAGSADVPMGTVESVVQDSFDVWGDPCCSSFSAAYQGQTSLTATNNQGRVVLSWTESSWNPNWGSVNVTIGVTFSQVYSNCAIAEAPIIFNGVGFRFSTNGSATDLQSIATHEIGHLTGLGHSQLQDATMFASYLHGSTHSRTLHQDDVDGVCSLYTKSCSCVSNSDCASGEVCSNRQCIPRPCQSNADCASGLECNRNTGQCIIPPCGGDADCADGFVCRNQICVSACPVCRRNCDDNADCGSGGYCVEDGAGGTVCIVLCGQNSECPGDSQCYSLDDGQGGTFYACGDPNATNNLCSDGYVCQDDAPTDECSADADCPGDEVCVNSVSGKVCQAPTDPCAGVSCPAGEVCQNGQCVDDGSSSNNGTNNGNTNNGNTGNNGTAGTNGEDPGIVVEDPDGEKKPPVIIIFHDDEEEEEERTCSTVPAGELPGSLLVFCLIVAARRRRRFAR